MRRRKWIYMFKLYYNCILNRRRTIIILFSILVIFTLSISASNFFVDKHEQIMNALDYQMNYNQIYTIIELILVITALLLLMNHDEKYQLPYIALIGRNREYLIKSLIYFIIISVITFIVFSIYLTFPILTTNYYVLDVNVLYKMLSTYLSILILSMFSFVVVNRRRKPLIFLLLVLYLFITFISEDNNSLIIFYLMPFSKEIALNMEYGMMYQALYVSMIYLFSIIHNNKRNLG